MSEPMSKKLCIMWHKSCDQCPKCDDFGLQPMENVWEDLLQEDSRAEQMSREHCRNLDDATSWPLFLINKSVERLRSLGTEIPRQTILSPLPKVDLVQTPALHAQDHAICQTIIQMKLIQLCNPSVCERFSLNLKHIQATLANIFLCRT